MNWKRSPNAEKADLSPIKYVIAKRTAPLRFLMPGSDTERWTADPNHAGLWSGPSARLHCEQHPGRTAMTFGSAIIRNHMAFKSVAV